MAVSRCATSIPYPDLGFFAREGPVWFVEKGRKTASRSNLTIRLGFLLKVSIAHRKSSKSMSRVRMDCATRALDGERFLHRTSVCGLL